MPDLVERLQAAAQLLLPHPTLIVCGGGSASDTVRRLDEQCSLSAERCHWDAIAAMSFNAHLLARLCRRLVLVHTYQQLISVWHDSRIAILDAHPFLQSTLSCRESEPLPASWDVTSDSIAVWTAKYWRADRLILAKSCDANGLSVGELASCGKLDSHFASVCRDVAVDWVNLRQTPFHFVRLQSSAKDTSDSTA